uniref:PARP catalytic domain-containing protein n=1 Tax=Erpetoichthys calabaricus TaxID=27687 RepID=A0A8C4RJS2_ERPCA
MDWHVLKICFFPGLKRNTKPINYNDYIMYHGTTKRKAQKIKKQGFKRSKTGMLGPGVYVSRDIRKASRYPTRAKPENRVVLELLVNVGKVKVINKQGHPMQKNWHKHGYDTAWVPPKCGMVKSGLQEDYCVWDPKQNTVLSIMDSNLRNNQVYQMFHGTTKTNADIIMRSGFKRSHTGMLGPGVYISRDIRKASRYPIYSRKKEKVVLELEVNVGRVKKIDRINHPMQFTWHTHGYDTAWVPPFCGMVPSGLEEDCVWDPKRIRVIRKRRPLY